MAQLALLVKFLAAAATVLVMTLAAAAAVPFAARFEGRSDIIGVVDDAGPIVQVQTRAVGSGVLGLASYFSADEVNLGSGAGTGTNRFVADDGSELFGVFTVQLVPTADPALLDLVGLVDFVGGSGRFAGADGTASFSGSGRFDSPTTALTSFDFRGELLLVPEPAAALLAASGIVLALAATARRRKPRGPSSGVPPA